MSKDLHLENIRREYSSRSLSRKDLPKDPIDLASSWIDQAIAAQVNEPTAVIVGTATPEGHPSMRTVLLKEVLEGEVSSSTPTTIAVRGDRSQRIPM